MARVRTSRDGQQMSEVFASDRYLPSGYDMARHGLLPLRTLKTVPSLGDQPLGRPSVLQSGGSMPDLWVKPNAADNTLINPLPSAASGGDLRRYHGAGPNAWDLTDPAVNPQPFTPGSSLPPLVPLPARVTAAPAPAQQRAPQPAPAVAPAPAVQAAPDLSWFQRNAYQQRDRDTGAYLDPTLADMARR